MRKMKNDKEVRRKAIKEANDVIRRRRGQQMPEEKMNIDTPKELARRRPEKKPCWGKLIDIVFMMQGQGGYDFHLEYIGEKVYELTITVYDNKEDKNRKEYVLHCHKEALLDLEDRIKVLFR